MKLARTQKTPTTATNRAMLRSTNQPLYEPREIQLSPLYELRDPWDMGD